MKQQINKNSLVSILVLLSFFITTNVTAVTSVLSSTGLSQNSPITPIYPSPINIKGYVIAHPPCMINEGKTVEVNFGDVLSTRVDGLNYKRLVDYHPSCEQMPINTLKLSVEGNGTFFDANALMTNITGLGIRILYQNKPLKLGQAINFTYPDFPVLEAVPVRDFSTLLVGGDFSTTATLRMEYQ